MAERICVLRDGQPKRAYATAQEAMSQIGLSLRYEPYSCPEHGWHIGTRRREMVWRSLASLCNKLSNIVSVIDSPKGDAATKLAIIRRIVSGSGAYYDDPDDLGKHRKWPAPPLAAG